MSDIKRIYDKNLKFSVVYGKSTQEFQEKLQNCYDTIFNTGHEVRDIKFFVDKEGYDAIIFYAEVEESVYNDLEKRPDGLLVF